MYAMILKKAKTPLEWHQIPRPSPAKDQILVRIHACGVCRTDLHILDGELPFPQEPRILGHQIVGRVEACGEEVKQFSIGDRVGIPWLGKSCGICGYCKEKKENLCDSPLYTGYDLDGGFAQYCLAYPAFAFSIPSSFPDIQAAPLLCGGLIGFRALRFVQEAKTIGFYGFGSAAHILIQLATFQGKKVYVFTRPQDLEGQAFAKKLGAVWAGESQEKPPLALDAALIFAPDGHCVPLALKSVKKAGVVVCAGIHMSDIPSFPYQILWQERVLRSVANLTRQDGKDFFTLAAKVPLHTQVKTYPLEKANEALEDLRQGKFVGAKVLEIAH